MPEDYIELSKEHVRSYLARERRDVERLRREIGGEIVDRLDRITLRDLVHESNERELARLLGTEAAAPRYRVMLNLKSGVVRSRLAAGPERRQRRMAVAEMRRAAQLGLARVKAHISDIGGEWVQDLWLTHSVVVEVTAVQLFELASRSDLATVNHTKTQILLCLDVSRPLIQADQVQNMGINGSGINVGVLDTGVDFTHRALVAVAGSQVDFTGEGTGDLHGHGSHCAGIVASQDETFRGIAPGATVHDYKILDKNGAGNAATCIQGIQQAVSDGRDVLSNSWGFSHANGAWTCPDGTCVLCAAANAAAAAGVVFVVAAGNDDNDTCATFDTHINCPGHATDAITVAASDDADHMASFSSIGPAADGRPKPDITAPGVDIISVRATTGSDMNGQATIIGTDFAQVSGTSQATPHVAGVCALMLDKNSTLSPAAIKSAIMSTAVNIGASANEMGSGRVNALAAVNAV